MNSGAHSESLSGLCGVDDFGSETTSPSDVLRTNMSSAVILSFWTPLGAMTTLSPPGPARIERPPPVPETQPRR